MEKENNNPHMKILNKMVSAKPFPQNLLTNKPSNNPTAGIVQRKAIAYLNVFSLITPFTKIHVATKRMKDAVRQAMAILFEFLFSFSSLSEGFNSIGSRKIESTLTP